MVHCRISDQLGLWAFTTVFSFWALVYCSCVDGAAATNAYIRRSLCGLDLPHEGADALSSSWRGKAGTGAWAGPGWALARMRHGRLLAALQGGTLAWALNTERPAFNCSKSADPAPPITTQTPRRDTAKGTADIVTLCSFPIQGDKPASTEGTLRGGGAAGGGDTREGGRQCDKKRWRGSKRAAAGGATTGRRGTVGTVRRQGGGRRGRRERCAGERGYRGGTRRGAVVGGTATERGTEGRGKNTATE